MKKFWKVLGITALAAAVVPVRFQKDEETGKKTFRSLLLSLDVSPDQGMGAELDLHVGEGVLAKAITDRAKARQESRLFTDDPEEAVLPADQPQDNWEIPAEETPAEDNGAVEADFDPEF